MSPLSLFPLQRSPPRWYQVLVQQDDGSYQPCGRYDLLSSQVYRRRRRHFSGEFGLPEKRCHGRVAGVADISARNKTPRRQPWCLFQDKSKWRKRVLVPADRMVVPDSESESEVHEMMATWNSEADSRSCEYCSAVTTYRDGLTGGEALLTICEACNVAY